MGIKVDSEAQGLGSDKEPTPGHFKSSLPASISRRANVFLIVATTACLVFAVAFALYPPEFKRTQVSWQPSSGDQSGTFLLSRGWPEALAAYTTCDSVRGLPQEVVLDAGNILMYTRQGDFLLEVKGISTPLTMRLPTASCAIQAGFSSLNHEVFIQINDQRRTLAVDRGNFPTITRLVAGGDGGSAIDRVEMVTRPTASANAGIRPFLGIFALLFCSFIVVDLIRRSRARNPQRKRRMSHPHPVDLAVLIVMLIAAVVIPIFLDDGWVLATVDAFPDRGVFASIFDSKDAWHPQGFLHLYAWQALRELGLDFFGLRVVVALILTLSWVLLRKGVLQSGLNASRASLWPAAGIFLAFSGAWLMTLRAEPFVVTINVIIWVLLVSFTSQQRPLPLLAGTALTGAAVATHQTGWVAAGPWLVMIALMLRSTSGSRRDLIQNLCAMLAGGSIAIVLFFLPFDLNTVRDNVVDFSAGLHNNTVFDELSRYSSLFAAYYGNAARIFSVAFLLTTLLFSALFYADMLKTQKLLWIASAMSTAGLLLTSSKWPWHFGVYAVPAAVLTALVVAGISSKERRPLSSPGFHVLLPATVLLVGMALSRSGNWGMIEGMPRGWEEFAATFGPDDHLFLWVTGIILAILLGLFANSFGDRFRARAIATIALAGLIVLPLMLSVAWIARNALETDGWSLVRQNLRAVANRDECGVLSDARFISSATPLPILAQRETSDSPLTEGAFPSITALAAGPLGEIPAWGSWARDDGQGASSNPAVPNSGTFTTPAFVVGGQDSIAVWTATEDSSAQSAEIVFEGADGSPTETVPLSLPVDLTWQLNLVTVPPGSSIAYVRVTDESTASGGWTAVSSAASVIQQPAPEAFTGKTAFVGPFVKPAYPCMKLPTPVQGYWPRFDYVVSDNDLWNNFQFVGLGLTNVGCSTSYPTCVYKASYPMAEVTATTVS